MVVCVAILVVSGLMSLVLAAVGLGISFGGVWLLWVECGGWF